MIQPPRPPSEPIINKYMRLGIIIQPIAKTAATLGAFFIGLFTDPIHYQYAETMAFVTLSFAELLRAFTARSEYFPLLKIGIFKNKWMNIAVTTSALLVLMVVYVPFFNGIFDTLPLGWVQWTEIIPLMFLPALADELTKFFFSPYRKMQKKMKAAE